MKRTFSILLILFMMTFGISAGAAATQNRVRITFVTPTVSPSGVLTLLATVSPHTTKCASILRGPSAAVLRLPSHRSTTGRIKWRYRMPISVPFGDWSAVISCGSTGHTSNKFVVFNPLPAAQVVATASGFTQSNYPSSSETFINYGVVLQNDSTIGDALGITVTVAFVDTLGRSVTSSETTLTGIPAGSKFYLGGLATSNVSLTVASMQVTVSVASTQKHRLVLPPVSGLSLQANNPGYESVNGTFTNPYRAPMSPDATVYVVYFGPQGNVVGGVSETAGAAVESGESVAFGFSDFSSDIDPNSIQPSSVSTAQSSVDPCASYLSGNSISFIGTCPAQVPAST
jgi:hypothetical protein